MEQSTDTKPDQTAITRSGRINTVMTRVVLCAALATFAAAFLAIAHPDRMVLTWAFFGALCVFVWSMGAYLVWLVTEPMARDNAQALSENRQD